jgi:hypothetical protein
MNNIDGNDANRRRDTTADDRRIIFFSCRAAIVDGVLRPGIQEELAWQLGFKKKTIQKLWTAMKTKLAPLLSNQAEEDHLAIIQANAHILFGTGHSSRRKGKMKYDREELAEAIKAVPLKSRMTVRHLAGTVGVSSTTIQRMLKPLTDHKAKLKKDGIIDNNNNNEELKRHSANLRPTLTDQNRIARFEFCCEQINSATMHLRHPKFHGQFDKVHVDEKWFHLCRDGERYILLPGEEPPQRHTKHKGYILKVMFLCAQARPRFDAQAGSMWDGKLGIWPIGTYKLAKRSSKNRPAGTQEWQNDTVDQEAYKEILMDKVFQAIIDKWPLGELADPNLVIKVQQDGAGGHCKEDDPDLLEYLESIHMDHKIKMYTQPANSPDLNILDLGLFNALQAAYYRTGPRNQVQLIEMVQRTYDEFPLRTINRVWLSLMCCFNEILEHHGGNEYKLPHMGKQRLERLNTLPTLIDVSDAALQVAQLR